MHETLHNISGGRRKSGEGRSTCPLAHACGRPCWGWWWWWRR